MSIAASLEQYRAEIVYFPNPKDPWHTATITLTKDASIAPDPLAESISRRISNRKPYQKDGLTPLERNALMHASKENELVLVEQPDELQHLGRVGSTNEEIMLANHQLHHFFFTHVSWTKEEDDRKKIGFYIKTLELPPPAAFMFKLFRSWSVMRAFLLIGFNRVVAKQNGMTNACASAMGAVMMSATEPIDFVRVGRSVERIWLTATSLGLSFQPLTGVLFFKLKIAQGDGNLFSGRERKIIETAYKRVAHIFNAHDRHVAFMFRIGHAEAPSAHASRFPLEEVVTLMS
jgi:hypothetical protein